MGGGHIYLSIHMVHVYVYVYVYVYIYVYIYIIYTYIHVYVCLAHYPRARMVGSGTNWYSQARGGAAKSSSPRAAPRGSPGGQRAPPWPGPRSVDRRERQEFEAARECFQKGSAQDAAFLTPRAGAESSSPSGKGEAGGQSS